MSTDWSDDLLAAVDGATEVQIATPRRDGTASAFVPIWAVTADGEVYVRTWYRRDTGWYGRAVRSGRARLRLNGTDLDVRVDDVGGDTETLAAVDGAYTAKYGHGSGSVGRMVSDEAAATTLRLAPRL
ncbi:Uncharacterized conserved protein UCP028498 [Gordonia bronchialis DSM 43247]|uniref:Uncharacterized conserved protein UCP028498 n=1 Tax=Gordonia bronchialis (strain ATCC 25592 / DSM 43247 / BCRC 13721 / JCM 3198 / KCTC 3076 / NBRC 16047 / NCTC 10667) TaxID=526226 RepID=D0L7D9_GORB4|nr:DUF2255 family protein [Gordonia bronchialis]ACY23728.1 Uncharacterized conserved protein UCP028498 [Gordonia bronchialis DSM 43247]MCC3321897.1 DUF2255 family protein [Gordonia bronchialis]QGS22947.1 DUF2255 family protein [Gordonia bronchialis]STQ66742.1 Uncharacterized protein conserved in bacteria (DUF2255) [Gordonia bronchialis]